MSFDVAPKQDLYTKPGRCGHGGSRRADQGEVRSDLDSDRVRAVPDQDAGQREGLIRLVMEGHLRGIIGQLTVEQIVKEPEMVADDARHLRGRYEQDGPGSHLVHHQGSP